MIDEEVELDRLYSLPPEEFISARNELAKRFRVEGERAIATRVKELRKPSVSAWVVNQLARQRELDVERLLRAGERLWKAQLQAVAQKDAGEFVEARRDEQAALNRLTQAAREILQSADRSTGIVDRVAATLRAAATKKDARQILKRGRLTEDLEPEGFEALASLSAAPEARSGPARSRASEETAAKRHALAEARKLAQQLDRRNREQRRHLEEAEREVERAREALEDAEAKATEARREVQEVEQAAERAKKELRRLS